MPVACIPQPHEGYLGLFSFAGKRWLHHGLTGEVVECPAGCTQLSFHEGQGILSGEAWQVWVWKHLRLHLVKLESGGFGVISDGSDEPNPLEASSLSEFCKARLEVQWIQGGASCAFDVMVHLRAQAGSYIRWSLPSIFEHLGGLATHKWHDWRDRRWKTWARSCHAAELPERSLLIGVASLDDSAVSKDQSPVAWATATTHAMLLLLLRWCSAHQQNGRVFLAGASEQLLRALFGYMPSSFSLEVFCSDVSWKPPYIIEGVGPATFHIQDGVVDLLAAQLSQPGAFSRFLQSLQEQGTCSLLELLLAAPCMEQPGGSEYGWLPQFLWQIGSLLEPALLGRPIDQLSIDQWWADSSLVNIGLATTRHDRGQHLWAYCDATRAKLQDVKILAIAVDDSRVGRKAWKLVAAMLPVENYAMWLPPQDPGDTRKWV
jgi:hypothetical protein